MIRKESLGPVNDVTKQIPIVYSKDSDEFEETYEKLRKKGSITIF